MRGYFTRHSHDGRLEHNPRSILNQEIAARAKGYGQFSADLDFRGRLRTTSYGRLLRLVAIEYVAAMLTAHSGLQMRVTFWRQRDNIAE